jgi:hypothetical protein
MKITSKRPMGKAARASGATERRITGAGELSGPDLKRIKRGSSAHSTGTAGKMTIENVDRIETVDSDVMVLVLTATLADMSRLRSPNERLLSAREKCIANSMTARGTVSDFQQLRGSILGNRSGWNADLR